MASRKPSTCAASNSISTAMAPAPFSGSRTVGTFLTVTSTLRRFITSNAEKELPDAFLRRCIFHYIEFPDRELMTRVVRVHHPALERQLVEQALAAFYALRDETGLRKRPSTSELIDWISALKKAGLSSQDLERGLPFLGVLLKREQDLVQHLERQAGGRGRA